MSSIRSPDPLNQSQSSENSSADQIESSQSEQNKKAKVDANTTSNTTDSKSTHEKNMNPPQSRRISLNFMPRSVIIRNPAPSLAGMSSQIRNNNEAQNPVSTNTQTASSVSTSEIKLTDAAERSSAYKALEKSLKEFSNIAMIIAPLGAKQDKTDIDIYSMSYGLILMSQIVEDAKRFYGSYDKNINIIGMEHGFTSRMSTLSATLENLKTVRNLLADHFIRIPSSQRDSLFNLEDDLSKLTAFSKDNNCLSEDIKPGACPHIAHLANQISSIQNRTVSHMDRYAYIVSCLERAESIKGEIKNSTENNQQKLLGVAMLYVVAGTCARDLRSKGALGDESNEEFGVLQDIVTLRNKLAHFNISFEKQGVMEDMISKLNEGYSAKIIGVKDAVELALDKVYNHKYLLEPPNNNADNNVSEGQNIKLTR